MKELADRWLSYADTDRQACSQLLGSPGLESIVAFHSQQTIEKSYKALPVFLDQSPPRIHDLTRLAGFVTAVISTQPLTLPCRLGSHSTTPSREQF